ncbi:ABC-type dipeptide/oligopeptide/nickel transport system permease subunit [Microbacterium proteolyticum]|uniref:hypothetical protein n=1 Tax=Microbacterium proteolyticum TaxID=1572644 RepID=UPI00277F37C4|nr:hypothetical protein [Microbacterium proteolyticum]MDQ1168893.1 ABC-type dipeptide/oligopeptide/nickel transport system permease subunit [Microbacterium proteolyticum]
MTTPTSPLDDRAAVAAFVDRGGIVARLRGVPVGVVIATLFLLTLAASALWPSLLQPHDPFAVEAARNLQAPTSDHLFGTDQIGRDVFSRVWSKVPVSRSPSAWVRPSSGSASERSSA